LHRAVVARSDDCLFYDELPGVEPSWGAIVVRRRRKTGPEVEYNGLGCGTSPGDNGITGMMVAGSRPGRARA